MKSHWTEMLFAGWLRQLTHSNYLFRSSCFVPHSQDLSTQEAAHKSAPPTKCKSKSLRDLHLARKGHSNPNLTDTQRKTEREREKRRLKISNTCKMRGYILTFLFPKQLFAAWVIWSFKRRLLQLLGVQRQPCLGTSDPPEHLCFNNRG